MSSTGGFIHLKIFGHTIRILKKDSLIDSTGNAAIYIPDDKKILIDSKQRGEDLDQTILHELVHCVFSRLGMEQVRIPAEVEELLAENIATCVVENFKIKLKTKLSATRR